MTMPASTEQLYDRHASTWNRQEPVLLSDYTARPRVLERLGSVAGLHIWDLGCGEGFMGRQLLPQRPAGVEGVDLSREMVEAARRQAGAGAMLAPLVEDEIVARHDVFHRNGDLPVDALRRAGAAFREATLVLGPQAMHDEAKGLGDITLMRIGIRALLLAVGRRPGQGEDIKIEFSGLISRGWQAQKSRQKAGGQSSDMAEQRHGSTFLGKPWPQCGRAVLQWSP